MGFRFPASHRGGGCTLPERNIKRRLVLGHTKKCVVNPLRFIRDDICLRQQLLLVINIACLILHLPLEYFILVVSKIAPFKNSQAFSYTTSHIVTNPKLYTTYYKTHVQSISKRKTLFQFPRTKPTHLIFSMLNNPCHKTNQIKSPHK